MIIIKFNGGSIYPRTYPGPKPIFPVLTHIGISTVVTVQEYFLNK